MALVKHKPARGKFNRRALLAALPAALAVGAVPTIAAIETPVIQAYREYLAHTKWIEDSDLEEDAVDAATDESERLLRRMIDTPAQGPADTAVKFLAVTTDYQALYENPYRLALEAEARALLA